MKHTPTKLISVLLLIIATINPMAKTPVIANDFQKLTICTALPPIQALIAELGHPYINADSLVSGSQSHELYEPRPSQLRRIKNTQVYVSLRLPFEQKWLAQYRRLKKDAHIIDLLSYVSVMPLNRDHAYDHEHEQDHDDPHIWLSPSALKKSAVALLDMLVILMPQHQEKFKANYKIWLAKINAIDIRLQAVMAPLKNSVILTDHPSWHYFARHFGIKVQSIEEGQGQLLPKEWEKLQNDLRSGRIKVAIFEKARSRIMVANFPAVKVLEVTPAEGNVLTTFEHIIQAFK